MARTLQRLGCRSAFVVHGEGSYDEISVTGPTRITRLCGDDVTSLSVTPEELGLRRAKPEEILGGDAAENAAIVRSVLSGRHDARRDMVLMNAAAALVAAGKADGLPQGVEMAAEAIDSGRAAQKLNDLAELSVRFSQAA